MILVIEKESKGEMTMTILSLGMGLITKPEYSHEKNIPRYAMSMLRYLQVQDLRSEYWGRKDYSIKGEACAADAAG